MDNEETNLFLSSDSTAVKSDSSNIFGGLPKASFGKLPENPGFDSSKSSSQNVPGSMFDSLRQKRKFGTSQLDTIVEERSKVGESGIFGSAHSHPPPSSSSFQSGNIFGGKTSSAGEAQDVSVRNAPPETETSFLPPASILSNPKMTVPGFDKGDAESKSVPFSFKKSVHSDSFSAPAPVFASQLKSGDHSKSSNIFGGPPSHKSSSVFPLTGSGTHSSQEEEKSNPSIKPKLKRKDSPSDIESRSFKKSLMTLPRPSLVFGSSIDKKPMGSSAATFKQDKNASHANSDRAKQDKSPQRTSPGTIKQSSGVALKSPKKESKDDSLGIFDSIGKETSDVVPQKKSSILIAVDIPKNYLNKSVLENHFMRFGTLKRIIINSKSNQASIYFNEHQSAAEAKVKGKSLHPLVPEMKLFFGAPPDRRKIEPIKKTAETVQQSPSKPQHSPIQQSQKSVEPVAKPVPSRNVVQSKVRSSLPVLQKKTDFLSKAPSPNLVSIKDVSVLMNTRASNNYDKYLILDARDKNIRSKQKKVLDVNKAQYLLAKCPDMCPEKERYSRDIQYDVSIYEMTNGEINHKLTVKKFSRSSADKDEPLPHELRPGPVLKMTMDFLICKIMEKGDQEGIQTDIWYNYLCNRTRALRNDITQQHLLDHNAVYVLERCTRFHIHCSHHLCEEPPDYFDAKINAEHLTKSLQSLKELYHDMAEKGFLYESEAEFRTYEILLSVNDGTIIFKYLKFRDQVRNSEGVQFAIKVFHSIHSNNYVQFFKLLKEATYLEACIMHRHFANVRLKALNIIVKAYSLQSLPVHKATIMLGFSDESQFKTYVDYFGISVKEEFIDKSKFSSKPETAPPHTKSHDIIIKKTESVGVGVENGPLPVVDLAQYHPHNSFKSGYLTQKALDASDQYSTLSNDLAPETVHHKATTPFEDLDNECLQKALQSKVEEMYKIKVFSRCFSVWRKFTNLQKEKRRLDAAAKTLLLKKLLNIWRKNAARSAELNRKADNHLQRKYLHNWKCYTKSSKENREHIQKAQAVEKIILARKFVGLWKLKAESRRGVKKANVARKYLLSRKYFTKWHSQTKNTLAEQRSDQFYRSKLLRSSLNQWKLWCSLKKSRNQMNLQSFPAMPGQYSVEQQNRLLDWGYKREDHLNMDALQMAELDEQINIQSRKHFSLQQLSGIVAWTALPLLHRFEMDVKSRAPDFSGNIFSHCFKLLLLVDSSTNSYLVEWVRTNFNILEIDDLSVPLQCEAQFTSHHNEVTYTIIVSEKDFSGSSRINLDGASFVILTANENKCDHLKRFAASSLRTVPHLILCKSLTEEHLDDGCWLMTKETIDNPYTSERLFNYVFNLWQLRSERCYLLAGKCSVILSKYISEKVLSPIYQVVSQRQQYGKWMPCPSKIVEFYNAAIYHARLCFEKSKSVCQDWPPSEVLSSARKEFSSKLWNKEDEAEIKAALQKALLPPFRIEVTSSRSCIETHLSQYIRRVVSKDDWGGNLFSEVMRIFKKSQRNFTEDDTSYDDASDALYHEVPWVDMIKCCIFYKLSVFPEVTIAYQSTDFDDFDSDERWLSDLKLSEMVYSGKEDAAPKRKAPLAPSSEPKKQKPNVKSQLLLDLEEERQKSSDYENELKALLLVEEELKLLCQNYEAFC